MPVCTFNVLTFSFDFHVLCILIVIELIFVCFWYSAVNVCMYVWSVDVANLMPLFCFMFIQGYQLLSASGYGDMATVRLLLEGDPNLVRYKDSVRRTE
jgi:hypothetical protein